MANSTPKGHKGFCENPTRDTYNNYQGSFDLELLVNPLVLDWVALQSFIIPVTVCGLENARKKVDVLSVL